MSTSGILQLKLLCRLSSIALQHREHVFDPVTHAQMQAHMRRLHEADRPVWLRHERHKPLRIHQSATNEH